MVIAYHLILTGYGHWLPNDPRGSHSADIRAGKLFLLGDIHYGPREPQPSREEEREYREHAKPLLEHPILWFDAAKRQAIADAFSETINERGYTCYACAILTNHAHLVIRKHRDKAETIISELKVASATRLRHESDVPESHPVWRSDKFKGLLSTSEDIKRTMSYVEANPAEAGMTPQRFDFVRGYQGEWSGGR